MDDNTFFSKIKLEIDNSGKTNTQVMNELGMYQGTYYDIFRKKKLDVLKFIQISEVLGQNPVDFFSKVYNNQSEGSEIRVEKENYSNKGKSKISDREEIDYLRQKVDQLIEIISELSKKIEPNPKMF